MTVWNWLGVVGLIAIPVAAGGAGGLLVCTWLELRDLKRAGLHLEHVNPPPGCGCPPCAARRDPRHRHLVP